MARQPAQRIAPRLVLLPLSLAACAGDPECPPNRRYDTVKEACVLVGTGEDTADTGDTGNTDTPE